MMSGSWNTHDVLKIIFMRMEIGENSLLPRQRFGIGSREVESLAADTTDIFRAGKEALQFHAVLTPITTTGISLWGGRPISRHT
jgi:hypothetical protein